MRWKHALAGLALAVAGIMGCRQQCFLHECDIKHSQELTLLPNLDCDPSASIKPATAAMLTPTTVLDPDRPIRHLTLAEAIAIALENGTTGGEGAINPGFASDNLVSFAGRTVAGDDSIRVHQEPPDQ